MMFRDLFLTHEGESRNWTLVVGVILFLVVGLTGCASTNGSIVKMSKSDVVGPVATVERTTVTTTTADGKTATTVTEKTTTMTASGADLELKKLGIKTVGEVGVANAMSGLGRFLQGGGFYGGGSYGNYGGGIVGGIGGNPDATCRNRSGDLVRCSALEGAPNVPFGTFPTSHTPGSGTNVVFRR